MDQSKKAFRIACEQWALLKWTIQQQNLQMYQSLLIFLLKKRLNIVDKNQTEWTTGSQSKYYSL